MVPHMTATMLPRLFSADDTLPADADVWHDQCRACNTLDTGGERFCTDCAWD